MSIIEVDHSVEQWLRSNNKHKPGEHCKLYFSLKGAGKSKFDRDVVERTIYTSLLSLHGQVGVGHDPLLTGYDRESGSGSVTVQYAGVHKLWGALTLQGEVEAEKCAFVVTRIERVLDSGG